MPLLATSSVVSLKHHRPSTGVEGVGVAAGLRVGVGPPGVNVGVGVPFGGGESLLMMRGRQINLSAGFEVGVGVFEDCLILSE